MKLQRSSTATDPFLLLIIHSVRMTVRWKQALGCVLTIFCSYLPMYLHRHIHIVKICSINVISSVRYILKSPDLFTAMQIVRGQLNALEELVDVTRALVQEHLHTRALGRGRVEYALYSPAKCAVVYGSTRPLPLEPPCNRVLLVFCF